MTVFRNPEYTWEYNEFERIRALNTPIPLGGKWWVKNKLEVIEGYADVCRIVYLEQVDARLFDEETGDFYEITPLVEIWEHHYYQFGLEIWNKAIASVDNDPFSFETEKIFNMECCFVTELQNYSLRWLDRLGVFDYVAKIK